MKFTEWFEKHTPVIEAVVWAGLLLCVGLLVYMIVIEFY